MAGELLDGADNYAHVTYLPSTTEAQQIQHDLPVVASEWPEVVRAESPLVNRNSILGWLATFVRLVVGVVWIWAGWSKLDAPRSFVQTVRVYDATPEWLSLAIGYGLPVLELALGLLLVVGIATRIVASVSAALFLVFLIGLVEVAVRGIKLACGCFGAGGLTTGATHYGLEILLAAVLLVLAVFLLLWPVTRLSLEEFLGRHDHIERPSAKRMRSEQGQRKYLAQIEAKRQEAIVRNRYIHVSLAVIVVLVGVIGIGVQAGRAKISGDPSTTHASAKSGIVYGKAAAARVAIYEDFQCTKCREFAQAVHTTLEADVKANLAQARFYPVAYLDGSSSGNRYSTRAANAALCAADVSVDAFVSYQDVLFGSDSKGARVQPAVGGKGRTNSQLVGYAKQAGLTSAQVTTFTTCVQTDEHKTLVEAITENASARGVTSTPFVAVNGTKLKTLSLAGLTAAIAAADAKGPAPSPSPTPAPAASKSGSPSSSGSPSASASVSPSASASTSASLSPTG